MPLLEYCCTACATVFERLVARAESQQTAECPVCREPRGQRVISLIAASVRGSDGPSTASVSGGGGCCGGACGCGSG